MCQDSGIKLVSDCQTSSISSIIPQAGEPVRLELQPIVVSHQVLRFQLNFSTVGEIPQNVEVWCKTGDGDEGERLVVEDDYQLVLDKVRPNTEYLCHGQLSLAGEMIEIPQTVVYTHCDVRPEVEVAEITQDSFRYVACSVRCEV